MSSDCLHRHVGRRSITSQKAIPEDQPENRHGAFIVIHHVYRIPTLLPKILARCTAMPLQVALPGQVIRPDHVYILPSGREMTAEDGYFGVRARSKAKGWTNVFSILLQSLARSRHTGIAVLLSGLDANGSAALTAFKESGGIIIAQSPKSAERPDMPQAAIDTGHVGYVLTPEQIVTELERISRAAEAAAL
jgi:chemotaxis response regulator CheB